MESADANNLNSNFWMLSRKLFLNEIVCLHVDIFSQKKEDAAIDMQSTNGPDAGDLVLCV